VQLQIECGKAKSHSGGVEDAHTEPVKDKSYDYQKTLTAQVIAEFDANRTDGSHGVTGLAQKMFITRNSPRSSRGDNQIYPGSQYPVLGLRRTGREHRLEDSGEY